MELRIAKGLTREELAEISGVSRPMISMTESGQRKHPSLVTIHALATALGVTVQDVVSEEETPKRPKKRAGSAQKRKR